MSAREEVHSYLVAALNQETLYAHEAEYSAEKLINDLLHEEAEKIRESKLKIPEGFTIREDWSDAWVQGRDDSADMIDPYIKGE